MRAADHRDESRARGGSGVNGYAFLRGTCGRARRQAQPLGAFALDPAPQHAPRRGSDDAETGTSTADDRNVDGEFVPPGQQFTGSVEGVTSTKLAAMLAGGARPTASSDTTHAPGSRRARPSRITASPA